MKTAKYHLSKKFEIQHLCLAFEEIMTINNMEWFLKFGQFRLWLGSVRLVVNPHLGRTARLCELLCVLLRLLSDYCVVIFGIFTNGKTSFGILHSALKIDAFRLKIY